MENEESPDRSNVHDIKRPKRRLSRTRIVMVLLLIVAIPIFIGLANKAVHENAEASRRRSLPRAGSAPRSIGLFDEKNCEHDAANRASTNLPIFAKDTAR